MRLRSDQYIVLYGSASTGFSTYGPFKHWADAQAYRDKMTKRAIKTAGADGPYGSYSVLNIYAPKPEGLPEVKKTSGCCCPAHVAEKCCCPGHKTQ